MVQYSGSFPFRTVENRFLDTAPHATTAGHAASLPPMQPLPNAAALRDECASFRDWTSDTVAKIPYIHEFMKSLGGCTSHGNVYWRQEEADVASILLHRWGFRAVATDESEPPKNHRCILVGSPGVGKSTLLCVVTFYLALVKKENVLVLREFPAGKYFFYVGHENNQVVYFTKPKCSTNDATAFYIGIATSQSSPRCRRRWGMKAN